MQHVDKYTVAEEVCLPSLRKRPPEKRYGRAAIGVVLSGCFDYHSQSASATAVPGTIVFGNLGENFFCRHRDAGGNRRQVVTFDTEFLERVAGECGLDEARFRVTAIPPGKFSAAAFGRMRRLALKSFGHEESAYELAGAALQVNQSRLPAFRVSSRNRRRVLSVVRYLETSYRQPCPLAELANLAQLSPYYFLRTFKKVTGQSPTQYVRHARLRAAANDLLMSRNPVSQIAFTTGFNDLSHFNASFRSVFGRSPMLWRQGSGM